MNPKVEQWLQAQKEAQLTSKRKQREKHLVDIGLIDENKCGYTGFQGNTLTKEEYDRVIASGFTAYVKKAALDVTDEEYAEICKYAPEKSIAEGVDDKAERGIMKFANTVKTIGVILWIILTLIGFIGGIAVASSTWNFSVGLFIGYFFIGAFSGFMSWLVCYLAWAVLKVFTNISRTLYCIEKKQA